MTVEVYLYAFFNLGTTWRWVANATPRPMGEWCPTFRHNVVSPSKVENVHENMYVSKIQTLNQNDRWKFSPPKMRPLGSSPSDEAPYPRRTFKVKVQVKVKVKFTLEQAQKAQGGGGSRGIALLFL
jgi:hypothetical protein